MSMVVLNKVRCAHIGCKTIVTKSGTQKRTLCKPCWHKKAEEAALLGVYRIHVAHGEVAHEMRWINFLQEFIDEYDIDRPEASP